MLFGGEYYLTSTYEEELDVFMRFNEDDGYNSLVIIDEYLRIEHYKTICSELDINYSIRWLTADSLIDDRFKNVFIHEVFDAVAQDFVVKNWTLLGFFR